MSAFWSMTSRRRSDIAALAFILLLSLILFRDSILHGRLFSEPDTVTFYYPVMSAVYRADYLFRAVRVPAGSHTVRFVFAPASFEIGRTISIATLFILLAAAAYGAHRRFSTAER